MANPRCEWSEQQAIFFIESAAKQGFHHPTILLQDGDGKSARASEVLKEHGCVHRRLPIHSSNVNAFAERRVKSVKRECLDYFVAFGERHLHYLLK